MNKNYKIYNLFILAEKRLIIIFLLFFFICVMSSGEDGIQNTCDKNIPVIVKVVFTAKENDQTLLTAVFTNNSNTVTITTKGKTFSLTRVLAADGARYADEKETTVFWIKGRDASLWVNKQLFFSGTAKGYQE